MEPGSTLTWPGADAPLDVLAPLTGPGAPFELAVEMVRGVPLQVFAQRPRRVSQLLASAATRFADRPYLVYPDRTVTFGEWPDLVAAVAASLRHRHGIGPGDRVAVASANSLEFALTFWATTVLGAVTVALNAWWTGPELADAVAHTSPKLVCADGPRMRRLQAAVCAAPLVELGRDLAAPVTVGLGETLPEVELDEVEMDEDDPFLILFTSGTTGRARGAVLSHRNQIHFMWSSILRAMEGAAGGVGPVTEPCTISA
ncbi:MAG: AMP-binding protein, partial [Actinomycetes bacterium]